MANYCDACGCEFEGPAIWHEDGGCACSKACMSDLIKYSENWSKCESADGEPEDPALDIERPNGTTPRTSMTYRYQIAAPEHDTLDPNDWIEIESDNIRQTIAELCETLGAGEHMIYVVFPKTPKHPNGAPAVVKGYRVQVAAK